MFWKLQCQEGRLCILLDDSHLNCGAHWNIYVLSFTHCVLSTPGLYCFQRDAKDEVPGCQEGKGFDSRADYCIPIADVAEDVIITSAPTETETISMSEAAGLILLGASEFLGAEEESTIAPTEAAIIVGALVLVGQNGSPSEVFPLSHCQGDCDNDEDVRWTRA